MLSLDLLIRSVVIDNHGKYARETLERGTLTGNAIGLTPPVCPPPIPAYDETLIRNAHSELCSIVYIGRDRP